MTADVVELTRQAEALAKRVEVLERGVTDDAAESLEAPEERVVFLATLTTGEVREVTATPDACTNCEACEGDPLRRGWTARADGEGPSYSTGDPRVAVMALCVGASWPVVSILAPGQPSGDDRERAGFAHGVEETKAVALRAVFDAGTLAEAHDAIREIPIPSSGPTIAEREAAAFKRGAEMVRGVFAQGGMRVVGSTDDLIRAFGEAAR